MAESSMPNRSSGIFPSRPKANDHRWEEVIVRARRRSNTELRRFPTTGTGARQHTIYAGDTIFIIAEVYYDSWIVAKVGHEVGWINTNDVRFIKTQTLPSAAPKLADTQPLTPPPEVEPPQPQKKPEQPEKRVSLTVKDVKKIVRYLRGISDILKAAAERTEKEQDENEGNNEGASAASTS